MHKYFYNEERLSYLHEYGQRNGKYWKVKNTTNINKRHINHKRKIYVYVESVSGTPINGFTSLRQSFRDSQK